MVELLNKGTDNYKGFQHADLHYEISLRNLPVGHTSILDYIREHYPFLTLSQINSVYGFHEHFIRLYGGRSFNVNDVLNAKHLNDLYKEGINYYIPLSNHYISKENYESSIPFLEEHQRTGNSIVCYSDKLARWIRRDFPEYNLVASVIKNLNNLDKLTRSLEIYDRIVLPPQVNDNPYMLEKLQEKDRYILFANNTCRYTCSAWVCYKSISRGIRDIAEPYEPEGSKPAKSGRSCSRVGNDNDRSDYIVFNIEFYREMGFRYFKLVPPLLQHLSGSIHDVITPVKHENDYVQYFLSGQIKEIFGTRDLINIIKVSSPQERVMFKKLNEVLSLFESGMTLQNAAKIMDGYFCVSIKDSIIFLEKLKNIGLIKGRSARA